MNNSYSHSIPVLRLAVMIAFLLLAVTVPGQEGPGSDIFKVKVCLQATPVKDQNLTNTCWCFSGLSMLESELLRLGKGFYDLSEMYIVRCVYQEKAVKYVRMHGTTGFAGGGAFNDVTEAITAYGIVPDTIYSGLKTGEYGYDHIAMDSVLRDYVDKVIISENGVLPVDWFQGFCCLLDSFLGTVPESFMAGGKTFTPLTYAESLLLNMDDYILLSSFSHHPLYEKFIIEIPDNWSWGEVYNVSLDELTDVIDHSLASGFTVAWAADVSEKDFSRTTGIATVSLDDSAEPSFILNEDQTLSQIAPVTEKNITREMRQVAFDNYSTTDDHGMHIIGIATDKYGKELYIVKNSWGADSGPHKGYYFVSKEYVLYKTTTLMVRKDALPDEVALKLFR